MTPNTFVPALEAICDGKPLEKSNIELRFIIVDGGPAIYATCTRTGVTYSETVIEDKDVLRHIQMRSLLYRVLWQIEIARLKYAVTNMEVAGFSREEAIQLAGATKGLSLCN